MYINADKTPLEAGDVIMKILYLCSVVILFAAVMLIKKNDKKQNAFEWFILTCVLFGCYNGILAVLYSAVNIRIDLAALSAGNLVLSACFFAFLIRTRKIQKYSIEIRDFIVAIVIISGCLYVFNVEFHGIHFIIPYSTTDPAIHFGIAEQISANSQLTFKMQTLTAFGSGSAGPFLKALNTAIAFNFFDGVFVHYRIYVVFDLMLLFLSGYVFYFAVRRFLDRIGMFIICIPMIIYYMFGYPLNTIVFGFPELLLAIIIIGSCVIIMQKIISEEINIHFAYPAMTILLIGVFYSYHLLIPSLLLGIGFSLAFFGFDFRKFHFLRPKKEIVLMVLMFASAIFMGLLYLWILPDKSSTISSISSIKADGAIYRSPYMDFFVPGIFAIYGFVILFRNKVCKVASVLTICFILFSAALFFLAVKGKVSGYYAFKPHYVLWFFVFYLAIAGMEYMYEKSKVFVIIFCVFILVLATASFENLDEKVNKNHWVYDLGADSTALFHIVEFNRVSISDEYYVFNDSDLELFKYMSDHQIELENSRKEIPTIARYDQLVWIYNMTGIWPQYNHYDEWASIWNSYFDYDIWKNDLDSHYLVFFSRLNPSYIAIDGMDLSSYEVVFQNASGIIVRK